MILLNIEKKITRPDTEISLKKQGESIYVAKLSPNQLESKLYIVVKSDLPERVIVSDFSRNIKIAAHEEIFAVHQAGLQGLIIEHVSRPPAGLSVDPENHYFVLRKEGRIWDKIVEKESIAFFLASEFKNIVLNLISYESQQ